MLKIAHIINPVMVDVESDLYYAQHIIFRSIIIAKEFAKENVKVKLLSAQFEEDIKLVPNWIQCTSNLERSVLDIKTFHKAKKLPLIADILDKLIRAQPNAHYYIYSNVDIGLKPHFYLFITKLIQNGVDAIAINRNDIPDHYKSIDELPEIYSEIGKPHKGIDCFVFSAKNSKKYDFQQSIVGSGPVGLCFIANMITHSNNFKWVENKDLTFHIGDTKAWKEPQLSDYVEFNFLELTKIVNTQLQNPILQNQFAKLQLLEEIKNLCISKLSRKKFMIHPKELLRELSNTTDYSQPIFKNQNKFKKIENCNLTKEIKKKFISNYINKFLSSIKH
jgi:hypothetical protein